MSDTTFDLGTSNQVPITVVATDANGNVVPNVVSVFNESDSTVVTLQVQPDGSAIAVRVSASAGSVVISATVTNPDGSTATGTLTLSLAEQVPVVPNVVNVEIVPGIPS